MWGYDEYNKWEKEGGELEKALEVKKLILRNNKFTSLPDHIGELSNLESLQLHNNQLTTLPDSIGELSNLIYLYLNKNQLTTLPDSIGRLSNLKFLVLERNLLTTLPDSIGGLSNLEALILEDNQLTTIPDSIIELSNLEELNLNNNQLTTLPESIHNLKSLKTLRINNNQLTTLPDSIGGLSNLKFLFLKNNQITTLPDSIGILSNLEALVLERNLLTTLPDSIANLSNLEALVLERNLLTTLPDSIANLSNLSGLYLERNQLAIFPDIICELSNLVHLYLQHNQLTHLPDSIGDLSKLETLYLQNNELTSLPDSIGVLNHLVVLRLDNNKLASLPDSLIQLYNLNSLYLDNNELTEIPEELLTIPNITYENNRIRIKGAEMTAWTGDNAITTNRDPYYIYEWPIDIIMLWIKAGGGVKVPGSHMGCGLNVLACLGFIDRNELPQLIIEQEAGDLDRVKTGLSMTRIIELSMPEPATSFYRFFIPFGKDKDATIRSALNDIERSVKLPSPERYRYLIVKLIISKEKGLGHTILVAYDSSTDKLVTFDPQNCKPNKTTERDFVIFANYLSKSPHYEGISVIKCQTTREGGTRRNRKKGKTLKKKGKKNASRRGGLVHTPFPFGLSKSKSHKIMEKSHLSKPKKIAPKTKELFNQLVEFVTDGEKKDKKLYAALKDWGGV